MPGREYGCISKMCPLRFANPEAQFSHECGAKNIHNLTVFVFMFWQEPSQVRFPILAAREYSATERHENGGRHRPCSHPPPQARSIIFHQYTLRGPGEPSAPTTPTQSEFPPDV